MPIFKLQYGGEIVGYYKTRDLLNRAIDKLIEDNPEAKRYLQVWIVWY